MIFYIESILFSIKCDELYNFVNIIITTRKTGGLLYAYKAFVLALLGLGPTEQFANRIFFSGYHLSGPNPFFIFLSFSFSSFSNGSTYSFIVIWSVAMSSCSCFLYILLFFFYFCLLYPHNSLYTKSAYFHICTLSLHVYQISSSYSFLSNIVFVK